jgi:hypothetical protein
VAGGSTPSRLFCEDYRRFSRAECARSVCGGGSGGCRGCRGRLRGVGGLLSQRRAARGVGQLRARRGGINRHCCEAGGRGVRALGRASRVAVLVGRCQGSADQESQQSSAGRRAWADSRSKGCTRRRGRRRRKRRRRALESTGEAKEQAIHQLGSADLTAPVQLGTLEASDALGPKRAAPEPAGATGRCCSNETAAPSP